MFRVAKALGLAFHDGDTLPRPKICAEICAPEVLFCDLSDGQVGSDWSTAVDVWTAAYTLARLRFGAKHIKPAGTGLSGSTTQPLLMLRWGGPMPQDWTGYWGRWSLDDPSRLKGVLSKYMW
jgi:hypothetical protein